MLTLGVAILRTRWQPIGGAKIERRRDWPASPRDLLVIVPDLENWPVAEFPMPYAQGFPSRSPSLTRPFSLPPPFLSFPLFRTEEDLYLRFLLYFYFTLFYFLVYYKSQKETIRRRNSAASYFSCLVESGFRPMI